MMNKHEQAQIVAKAENLTRVIDGQPIVNDVSIDVRKGEVALVVGESGSGKSTLVRMMSGIDTPTSGNAYMLGENITTMSKRQRSRLIAGRVGIGFQAHNLATNLSTAGNLFGLVQLQGRPPKRSTADTVVDQLGLGHRMNTQASKLSGGEKMKVALGRVLMTEPELLILDEPTSALDHEGKETLMRDIANTCQALGTTALIVSHDIEAARKVADRAFVMRSGVLLDEIVRGPEGLQGLPGDPLVASPLTD